MDKDYYKSRWLIALEELKKLRIKPMEKTNFAFLKSERFWVMVAGAVVVYVETKGWIGAAERNLVLALSAGFVGVRTVDRFGEQVGR